MNEEGTRSPHTQACNNLRCVTVLFIVFKVSNKPEQFSRALKTFFSNSTDKHF